MPDPDELCGVCNTARDLHGDKQHEFNLDGQLIPKKPAAPAQNTPPQARGSVRNPLKDDPTAHAFVRLVEILNNKGVLSVQENAYIFGGFYASDPGETQAGASALGPHPFT